ncbi:MAG: peptidylprolyl isomerase [Planctomycetota bacterium]
MSASLPKTLDGSQAPTALELLWERHKKTVKAVFWLLALALLGYYGWQYYQRKLEDQKWSAFAASTHLRTIYSPEELDFRAAQTSSAMTDLSDQLASASPAEFQQAYDKADESQKPFFLWLMAIRGARSGDYAAGLEAARKLQSQYPNHPLCVESPYPVQVRKEKEAEEGEEKDKASAASEGPELEPAVHGSTVGLLIQSLEAAQSYTPPPQFSKPTIPDDAPRYRVNLDGEYGSFTIALMTKEAPKICAKFEELVQQNYWSGIKVDEITRIGKEQAWMQPVKQFHFGFEVTKTEENRSEWDTSKASPEEHTVSGEFPSLSHFEGAVAARWRTDKSEVDHLFVVTTDSPIFDMGRQVFAYIVEGLDNAKAVTEVSFARAEDEQRGRGLPAENITITSIEKL